MAEDVFGIIGSVIAGTYQVETVVAEGGFGVVYRAHHVGFRAAVALKCLKIPQQLGTEYQVEFLEQFRAEAELLFRLSASIPTVVRPLHVDAVTTADGTFVPFMALEWLEGETLDAIVARRKKEGRAPLSLKKLVRLLTPVARALERAHNFSGPEGPISIVHRDLKPENIFVAKVAGEELVKILDFGIGKAKSVASQVAGRASQTQSRMASFTPAYGAPEQWVPKRYGQTGPWTDVWGLALTLVEMMAARPIIDGDQAGMMGTALDPTRRPTPRNEGLEVDDAVEAVFARALAVDPRDRPGDAGLFWNDLLAALGMEQEVGGTTRRGRMRDLRSDGGVVPRVETIEAAMDERPSRISGTQSISPDPVREAPTLDAVAASGTGSSGAAWPAIGMFRRSAASGELPAVRPVGMAPAVAEPPALEIGPPPPALPTRPVAAEPAAPERGVDDTGLIEFDGPTAGQVELSLESGSGRAAPPTARVERVVCGGAGHAAPIAELAEQRWLGGRGAASQFGRGGDRAGRGGGVAHPASGGARVGSAHVGTARPPAAGEGKDRHPKAAPWNRADRGERAGHAGGPGVRGFDRRGLLDRAAAGGLDRGPSDSGRGRDGGAAAPAAGPVIRAPTCAWRSTNETANLGSGGVWSCRESILSGEKIRSPRRRGSSASRWTSHRLASRSCGSTAPA